LFSTLIFFTLFGVCFADQEADISENSHSDFKEKVVFIPAKHHTGVKYETTVFTKETPEPSKAPIVILVHGTSPKPGGNERRATFIYPTRFFIGLGCTVVIPMRRGFSQSSGPRVDVHDRYDLTRYGLDNASDLEEVVEWVRSSPDWNHRKIVMIGQSTGGLCVMAYSSLTRSRVDAIINFHGGIRPSSSSDPILQGRINAFATFGHTSKPESLWIYTANDHSSNPDYIQRLHAAFTRAGGKAELHQLPAFKEDGHILFGDRDGGAIWQPIVLNYLNRMDVFTPSP